MDNKMLVELEGILKGKISPEELAEIEKVIREARGNIPHNNTGFWDGKTPCWEMCTCPDNIKLACPAHNNKSFPCWEVEGTYCKLDDYGKTMGDTSICHVCRVYRRWGNETPIEINCNANGVNNSSLQTKAKETRV